MDRSATRAALHQPQRNPPLSPNPLLSPMSHPFMKVLYTPEEAAEVLSSSRSRLYLLLARAAIASIKAGRARLIPAVALDQYMQRRLAEQPALMVVAPPSVLPSRGRKG